MIGQGNGFGVSFLPNGDQRYQRPDEAGPAGGRAPLQEAVRILSMRVPRVVGANPLAPLALLNGPGAGGLQPGQLEQLMRTLGLGPQLQAGPESAPMGQEGPSVGGAPSPFAPSGGAPLIPPSRPSGGGPVGGVPRIIATDPGGGTLPMPAEPAPPVPPAAPEDDSAAMWELARRQREGMGRISY